MLKSNRYITPLITTARSVEARRMGVGRTVGVGVHCWVGDEDGWTCGVFSTGALVGTGEEGVGMAAG